jgi:Fe-S cluster assembly ATP-binding protein
MMDGRIVLSGGPELAERIEREGYEAIREEVSSGAA